MDNLEILIAENELKKAAEGTVKTDIDSDDECMNTSEALMVAENIRGKFRGGATGMSVF